MRVFSIFCYVLKTGHIYRFFLAYILLNTNVSLYSNTRKSQEYAMKRSFFHSFCIIFVLIIFSNPGQLPCLWGLPDQEHEPIVEEVAVYNVEVPVRVLFKGKPVENLTKEDFTVYERNKEVKINGFFIKRKTIKINQPTRPLETQTKEISLSPSRVTPRTFVLTFNITDYNMNFQKAMDHLFDKILQPTDHIIIFANDVTREYTSLKDIASIKSQILNELRNESQKARIRLIQYIKNLETELRVNDFRQGAIEARNNLGQDAANKLITFLQKCLLRWEEYKKIYLLPRVDRFYYFARYLKRVQGEKYVLNFYQFELFPKIRLSSRTMHKIGVIANALLNTNDAYRNWQGNTINKTLNQLNVGYDLNSGFPNEEITKLFYNVDATFHSFFIRPLIPSLHEDFEYMKVASDLENVLKGITDLTGGKNISSNDLVNSLDIVSELEDVYYIITYVPQNPKKAGKLKIKVNNKKYKVLYDNQFRYDYINEYLQNLEEKIKTPDIKIENFSFDRKILAFTVTDYLVKEIDDKMTKAGRMKVRIRVKDSNSHSLFDQEKMLTAQEDQLKISLAAFKNLKKGEYDFFIDAQDIFTGKEANLYQKIKIK